MHRQIKKPTIMKKYFFFALVALLLIGCHSQKNVVTKQQYADAHFPISSNDSICIEHNDNCVEVKVKDYKEIFEKAYVLGGRNLPLVDEAMPYNLKETEASKLILQQMSANGDIRRGVTKMILSLSDQHRLQLSKKDAIHMFFTYLVPIDNVHNVRLVKVQIYDLSSDLTTSEAKALFDFAASMPVEFEYEQYKNYTTGYLMPTKRFWCKTPAF